MKTFILGAVGLLVVGVNAFAQTKPYSNFDDYLRVPRNGALEFPAEVPWRQNFISFDIPCVKSSEEASSCAALPSCKKVTSMVIAKFAESFKQRFDDALTHGKAMVPTIQPSGVPPTLGGPVSYCFGNNCQGNDFEMVIDPAGRRVNIRAQGIKQERTNSMWQGVQANLLATAMKMILSEVLSGKVRLYAPESQAYYQSPLDPDKPIAEQQNYPQRIESLKNNFSVESGMSCDQIKTIRKICDLDPNVLKQNIAALPPEQRHLAPSVTYACAQVVGGSGATGLGLAGLLESELFGRAEMMMHAWSHGMTSDVAGEANYEFEFFKLAEARMLALAEAGARKCLNAKSTPSHEQDCYQDYANSTSENFSPSADVGNILGSIFVPGAGIVNTFTMLFGALENVPGFRHDNGGPELRAKWVRNEIVAQSDPRYPVMHFLAQSQTGSGGNFSLPGFGPVREPSGVALFRNASSVPRPDHPSDAIKLGEVGNVFAQKY